MSLTLGLVAAGAAQGALPGVPEAPAQGSFPGWWLGWSNDAFAGELGENPDDLRTNAISGGLRLGERWLVAADYSILTNRGRYRQPPGRIDEATAALGWLPWELRGAGNSGWIALGVAGRYRGDLDGDELQNGWHRMWDTREVVVPYDPEDSFDGLAWWSAGGELVDGLPRLPLLADAQIGLALRGSGSVAISGEWQLSVGARVELLGVDGGAHAGISHRWQRGVEDSPTADIVAEQEEGLWFDAGVSAGGWFLDVGVHLEHGAALGTLGWRGDRMPRPLAFRRAGEMEGGVALYQGYSLGWQYRWQPDWLAGALGDRLSLLLDYRFGRYPGPEWYGNVVVTRQVLLGMEIAAAPPRPGWQLVPFAYAGVGARDEEVIVVREQARFGHDETWSGVVQAGGGLRLYWGQLPRIGGQTARYGVSMVYDWWMPFTSATVENGDDVGTYLEAHGALGARLAATVLW